MDYYTKNFYYWSLIYMIFCEWQGLDLIIHYFYLEEEELIVACKMLINIFVLLAFTKFFLMAEQ